MRYVANSHLHFDHCGGNEFFPRATFLVQRPELEAARKPGFVPRYSPSPIDFDHPLDYQLIDGEHDVFGDGTVVLLPTYGHTPGHQSLRVRAGKDAHIVCASDACYTRENMDRDVLPEHPVGPGRDAGVAGGACGSCATRAAPPCSTGTTPTSGRRFRASPPR